MFPKYLDGAEILWHTEKGNYGFTKYNTGEIDEKICYFAIAKYKGAIRYPISCPNLKS